MRRPALPVCVLAVCVLVVLVVGPLAAPAAAEEDPGYVIDRFSSAVTVGEDGTLTVVEEIAVDFFEERRGIFRAIPLRSPATEADVPSDAPESRGPQDYWRLIEIDDVAVGSTAPDDLVTEEDGGALVLRIGDEDTEISGPQTYRITYTVSGALDDVGELAELRWNVTGAGWDDIPMAEVVATVTAPSAIAEATCAAGPTGSTDPCAVDLESSTATFRTTDLAPGEQLTVRVAMPTGTVAVAAPVVTERWRLTRALTGNPLAWPLAAVAAMAVAAGLVLILRRGRDEAAPPGGAGVVRYDPPEDVRPAELSAVLDERVDRSDLSATLVDLAERGFVEIEQLEGDDDERDWRLRQRSDGDPSTLRGYERDLLAALFADGDEVDLDEVEDFHTSYAAFRDGVYDETVRRGWFPISPAKVRARWLVVAIVALVATVALLAVLLVMTELALVAVPLVLGALVFTALHGVMPHRTADGSRVRAEAQAYRDGLDAQQPPGWQAMPAGPQGDGGWGDPRGVFGRHLGYAVALGAVPALVHRMRASGAPVAAWAPYWYIHPAGVGAWRDPDVLSTDLGSFAEHAGAGLGATPGSGAGGGGVSAGGGVGGGGGGGW